MNWDWPLPPRLSFPLSRLFYVVGRFHLGLSNFYWKQYVTLERERIIASQSDNGVTGKRRNRKKTRVQPHKQRLHHSVLAERLQRLIEGVKILFLFWNVLNTGKNIFARPRYLWEKSDSASTAFLRFLLHNWAPSWNSKFDFQLSALTLTSRAPAWSLLTVRTRYLVSLRMKCSFRNCPGSYWLSCLEFACGDRALSWASTWRLLCT